MPIGLPKWKKRALGGWLLTVTRRISDESAGAAEVAGVGSGDAESAGAGVAAAAADSASVSHDAGGPAPAFNCDDLSDLNMDVFPTADEAYATLQDMVDFGPRHTGSEADIHYIDYLEQRMKDAGLEGAVQTEVHVNSARPPLIAPSSTSGPARRGR